MVRNRRNSSVTSYKSTIGLSLLKLFLATTIVVLCVLKVIFGGEYISDCPSEPLLPVYVVISGCLPVFLGTLRGSESSGPSKDGYKFWRLPTYYKAVLCFGIIANFSWLIFGTVLVTRLITNGKISSANCSIHETNGHSSDLLNSHVNSTSITGMITNPVETNQSEEIKNRMTDPDETNQFEDSVEKTRKHLDDKNDTSSIGKAIKSTTEGTTIGSITNTVDKSGAFRQAQSDETLTPEHVTETALSENTEPKTKKILPVLDKSIKQNLTHTKNSSTPNDEVLNLHNIFSMSENKRKDYDISKAHNASLTDELLSNAHHTSKCATCSRRLVSFTLVIASIDWLIAIFGIIFVIVVLFCKMPSFKEMVPFLGSV